MNNTMYKKEELYKIALSNVHKYSLLNEIFAIRDERLPKEQQENTLCVNGYIGIDTLDRYVRYINELVEYQNIDTIENLKEKDKEIERLNNEIKTLLKENSNKEKVIIKQNNIIDELEKELDNLIIFNQSDITCNHYTPDDWKDSKLIDNMLYKMKPVSFLAQELKDKLNKLKKGVNNENK